MEPELSAGLERNEKRLDAIERELRHSLARPAAFTRKDAAKLLGFSRTKLIGLIRNGEIAVCQGDPKMIPRSAIESFTHPAFVTNQTRRSRGRRKGLRTYNAHAEAEKIRLLVRLMSPRITPKKKAETQARLDELERMWPSRRGS